MDPSLLFRGAVLGFCIAAPVGPIGILCVRRTLSESRASGFASGLGAATADAIYGVVAAFGITIVSEALMKGRLWLAVAGGLFLCWLGWRTLSARPPDMAPAGSSGTGPNSPLWGAWGSAFLLTITNPMTILSFGAAALLVGGASAGVF